MKILLPLALLLLTIACEKKSHKEHCEINGQVVDCREMREERNQRQSPPETLNALIEFAISIEGDKITILENKEDIQETESHKCGVSVTYGDEGIFKLVGTRLKATSNDGKTYYYDRVGIAYNSMQGEWRRKETKMRVSVDHFMTINTKTMSMGVVCQFK